ncbi:FMN-dependent NADH-azoreductase [Thermolongibacillus altinsuensis]|jgi:FMN-dependent NADH-azoreductase|uniref:FMN dependent NADH:quinone oxidoreductase n=1 Tax=Thermolongibacillus altinsuensis TaxID=575256 RepID=A0A4R1QE85_9BACL|nr:FMN-dependent NADH-azoreductase [Thermolongibacillus altinsuensis]TCL49690.1 FMN-dependent NADH-azoreductase [Thermolongibacillus altinsuensis]GMB09601.1 FMN-dependent NADH-azoreductase 2 [Thermolongibacillus altinsuensis]
MAKLLYITANPKTEDQSFSLSVGRAFLNAYKQQNPQDEVVELDLYQTDIPYIDADVFSGWGKLQQGQSFEQLSEDEKQKVSRINQLTDQFIEADKYVFVTPMWNFSVPPKMKAYIDTICIAGKTFKYTENGPVGLLTNKKAVHIQARGGIYSEGPAKDMEFGDRYLKAVLGFIGITNVQSIIVEGMAAFPNEAEGIKEKAIKQAQEVAKNF